MVCVRMGKERCARIGITWGREESENMTPTSEPGSGTPPVRPTKPFARRVKLRYLLFFLVLLSGIIPLLISSMRLIGANRDLLKTQETVLLTSSAQALAGSLSDDLARHKERLYQLGEGLLAPPGLTEVEARIVEDWAQDYMRRFLATHSEIFAFNVVDREGVGLRLGDSQLTSQVSTQIADAFEAARRSNSTVFRFVSHESQPWAAITVPVMTPDGGSGLVIQALVPVPLPTAADGERGREQLFLIDHNGSFLWSAGGDPQIQQALLATEVVRDFGPMLSVTRAYDLEVDGTEVPTLARVVAVPETGWGVVVHKPAEAAFEAVEKMVLNTLFSSLLLVILALVFAVVAARWLSQPIQQLTATSHEIAAGHFDRRVPTAGLAFEIADLAENFNRMSDYVESYVAQLRRAAKANRELFISSIRAFAAAIDAKDPYTRGHSERVAAYSRAIAGYLGLTQDMQERVWVSAVLHDIGKIGVEDRILKKQEVLTPEEFEQMKLHTVIGADIATPIAELEKMIPGIRWHHEAWNGTGYPDGLKGEQIPLIARIIGIADTFDAITTNRPYQNAYDINYALETIKRLAGTKFDAKIVTAFLSAYQAGHIELARQEAETTSSDFELKTAPFFGAN